MYDRAAFREFGLSLVPQSSGMYYLPVYGPQMALLFAPFALFPYLPALLLWILVTVAIFGACCWAVWKTCAHLRQQGPLIAVIAAAFPAFFNLIAHGQNSALALACLTSAFLALRQHRRFLAGLAIGMLIYKPQLGIVSACVFVLSREWPVVAGALSGLALQLGVAWVYVGTSAMRAYYDSIRSIPEINHLLESKPYQMHSLLSFWKLLIPNPRAAAALYIGCACVVLFASFRVWRTQAPLPIRYSFLLLATVLVSPHLFVYDLVILAPALLMVGDWTIGHCDHRLSKPVQRVLYCSYALPLVGGATKFTHVQASVLAMGVLSWMVASIAFSYEQTQDSMQRESLSVRKADVCERL